MIGAAIFFGSLYVWTICRLCKKHPEPVQLNPCGNPHGMAIISTAPRLIDGFDYTIALYRCRHCGVHQTVMHHGRWELGDFVQSENEIDTIARMAK